MNFRFIQYNNCDNYNFFHAIIALAFIFINIISYNHIVYRNFRGQIILTQIYLIFFSLKLYFLKFSYFHRIPHHKLIFFSLNSLQQLMVLIDANMNITHFTFLKCQQFDLFAEFSNSDRKFNLILPIKKIDVNS